MKNEEERVGVRRTRRAFRDESSGDVEKIGTIVRGRIVRGSNIRGRNVLGCPLDLDISVSNRLIYEDINCSRDTVPLSWVFIFQNVFVILESWSHTSAGA